jgi:cytochrome c-type biogenesis protein CcmH/NrfF
VSTVPASSGIMLIGTMLAFFGTAIAITFQLSLIWWSIPVACAVVVLILAVIRYRRHRRMREALHGGTL